MRSGFNLHSFILGVLAASGIAVGYDGQYVRGVVLALLGIAFGVLIGIEVEDRYDVHDRRQGGYDYRRRGSR